VGYTPPTQCEGDDCDDTDPSAPNGGGDNNNDFESNNSSGSFVTQGLLMVFLMGALCMVTW